MKSLKEFIAENLEESTIATIQESTEKQIHESTENRNKNIEEAEKSTSENNIENVDKQ